MFEAKANAMENFFDVQCSGSVQEITIEIAGIIAKAFQKVAESNRLDAITMAIIVKEVINQCDPLLAAMEQEVEE